MDNNQHKFQTTGKFHLDLDRVKTDALEMGGMVESQLYNAMGLIKKRNDLLATKIIKNDIKINLLEKKIDDFSCKVIAKYQPMASDLRLLVAIIKVIANLERIANTVTNIAQSSKDGFFDDLPETLILMIWKLTNHTLDILTYSLNSFARMEFSQDLSLPYTYNLLQSEYEDVIKNLQKTVKTDLAYLENVTHIFILAREIKRITNR